MTHCGVGLSEKPGWVTVDCGVFSLGKLSTFSTQAKGQGVGIGEQQSDRGEEEILRVEKQGMI